MRSTQCNRRSVVYTVRSTQCHLHGAVNTVPSTWSSQHGEVYMVWSTRSGPHGAVHTVRSTQRGYTVSSALCPLHCALCPATQVLTAPGCRSASQFPRQARTSPESSVPHTPPASTASPTGLWRQSEEITFSLSAQSASLREPDLGRVTGGNWMGSRPLMNQVFTASSFRSE